MLARPQLAFCELPAQRWKHLRTWNPIKSTFATVGAALSARHELLVFGATARLHMAKQFPGLGVDIEASGDTDPTFSAFACEFVWCCQERFPQSRSQSLHTA